MEPYKSPLLPITVSKENCISTNDIVATGVVDGENQASQDNLDLSQEMAYEIVITKEVKEVIDGILNDDPQLNHNQHDSQPQAEPETESGSVQQAQQLTPPEQEADLAPEADNELEIRLHSEVGSPTAAQAEDEASVESAPEPEVETEIRTVREPEPEPKPQVEVEVEPAISPESANGVETGTEEPRTDTVVEPEIELQSSSTPQAEQPQTQDCELINEEQPELEYIVEKILDKKIDSRGHALYLVKWENYPSTSNTWEPLENLVECEKAMQEFEQQKALSLESSLEVDRGKRKRQEFEVNDVMGLTRVGEERYFLVSLANTTKSCYIRASLANRLFPDKVIDFYIKHLRWKRKSELK